MNCRPGRRGDWAGARASTTGAGAGLGDVAHGLLLDRRDAAPDVPLRGLGAKDVGPGGLDERHVPLVEAEKPPADVVVDTAGGDEVLPAGQLSGLPEDDGPAGLDVTVNELPGCRTGRQAAGGIGLAALDRDHDLVEGDRHPRLLGSVLEHPGGLPGAPLNRPQVPGSL